MTFMFVLAVVLLLSGAYLIRQFLSGELRGDD
jgi:hypothetical protein